MMRYLSLFSGVGGFDLGFDRAGMECAGQVEYDEKARTVLARHWPDVKRLNDVKEVKGDEFGAVDVICGGFPCQDVSVAGRREGLAGERSGLWFEFYRIIERVKPRWVVIENVPGLLSSNAGRDFAAILSGLVECGYGVAWRVLDAQYFGVPQRRRRVFIVGHLGGGRAAEVLFEREGGGGDIAESRSKGAIITQSLTGGASSSSAGNPDDNRAQGNFLVAVPLRAEGHDASEDGTGRQNLVVAFSAGNSGDSYGIGLSENITPPLRAGNSGTNQTPTIAITPWDHQTKRIHRTNGVAPTLAGSDGGGGQRFPNFATSYGVRRLTPVECERLQGFPDGHTDGQSDSARYRQMGNAVAVPVAEWIGRRIVEADE